MVLAAGRCILMRKLAHGAEGEEGTETKRGGRMGILQGVADEDTVLVGLEDGLSLQ